MSFVEILKVIVLGIVEGFTEWLPISSTGHMILVDEIIIWMSARRTGKCLWLSSSWVRFWRLWCCISIN